MFKKLKDKLAEEVKSSPQRIQQFAQAAQAAVTSASSSISDITNSDLFSIGDNDSQQTRNSKSQASGSTQPNTFQDVALVQPLQSPNESTDYMSSHDILENQRQRRLSNSSFASDVSFRLPSYETPSMYHLQSDMEVSASEAEERGFSSGAVSLDRVTKEQLYAAYRRTQERYTKYRTQYGDLARHYKLLERENAKARSVLVETQDKALRRISELREQCTLEQSAKAHLEKALRFEIDERNMKIEALTTKCQLLQNNPDMCNNEEKNENINKVADPENEVQLINLSNDNENVKPVNEESLAEITALNNKIEKMEQLLNKYKESLKVSKEKNSQVTTELQIVSNEIESKNKEIEKLKSIEGNLAEAKDKIQELNNLNEELQNKINVYEFNKTREQSTLEIDLEKAQEEIAELRGKIEVFSKREEEYAISLAENKLSIHKELESKEAEIKSLKDSLDASNNEVQSLNIALNDYKNNMSSLELEKSKLINDCNEVVLSKAKITELETQIVELTKKCHNLEQLKTKADEEYKCLQLQLKQETAEKLAMIDRNVYLENRNTQLGDENTKKSLKISSLENELQKKDKELESHVSEDSKKDEILCELGEWKDKYAKLESEIQEERDELIKLQSEIEKLLANHELLQSQNIEFRKVISDLESDNAALEEKLNNYHEIETTYGNLASEVKKLRKVIDLTSTDARNFQNMNKEIFDLLTKQISETLINLTQTETNLNENKCDILKQQNAKLEFELKEKNENYNKLSNELSLLQDENNNLKSTINELELGKSLLDQKIGTISEQYENGLKLLNSLKEKNENFEFKISEYEHKIKNLQISDESEKTKHLTAIEKCNLMENEKLCLEKKNQELRVEITTVTSELEKIKNEYKSIIDEFDAVKRENDVLLVQSKDLDIKSDQISKLQEDNNNLTYENICSEKKNQELRAEITTVTSELEKIKNEYKSIIDEFDAVKRENDDLLVQSKDLDIKNDQISKLQEDNKNLTYENISLKGQAENIATSLQSMEIEISELRKSHNEIEKEKNHLNEIIEKLESNANRNIVDKDIQTDCPDQPGLTSLERKTVVTDLSCEGPLEPLKHDVNNKTPEISLDKEIEKLLQQNTDLLDKHDSLKADYDILKEENRRYKSDIEGLQTYLTKISKENSVLNDKLRESIATSEHSTENNISSDLTELKNEVQFGKDKIDDLLRENNLLVEENLELKDQLESQNYFKPQANLSDGYGQENTGLKEKYNHLLQVNSTLESRLIDLEQMNKSVNLNMVQMQDRNEKLRSSNEKLERRLDEALVSLRHLHALQENTELEYLRNILYEYLTGSGTHSVTLAKVLSAIVKFDDMQTKLVLQKEKERQGFLRQLGII